jgi:hypothetical protein
VGHESPSVKQEQAMKERQTETLASGRAGWRKVLVWYLATGAALAILRVAALVWLDRISMGQHAIDHFLTFVVLYPENALITFASLSILHLGGLGFWLVWIPIIALVSFAVATPILLVGWLAQRRRYLVSVAVLAVARIAVLAGVTHRFGSERMNEVFHHLRWALFPEALLVTRSVLGQMSISWTMSLLVGSVVLLWGSVVLATPILMVDHLAQRRR